MRDLKELQIARQALIKDRTAAKNRAKSINVAMLKRQNANRLRQIGRDLAAIEKKMLALITLMKSGRKFLREALYMPALVALRFNPDMKAKYQQLKNTHSHRK